MAIEIIWLSYGGFELSAAQAAKTSLVRSFNALSVQKKLINVALSIWTPSVGLKVYKLSSSTISNFGKINYFRIKLAHRC